MSPPDPDTMTPDIGSTEIGSTDSTPAPAAHSLFGQVLRFAFVGLLTAAVDFGVLSGLIALGVSPYPARVVSIAAALVVTWLLNRNMTFRAAAAPSWGEFMRYAATAAMGAVINYLIYSASVFAGLPVWLAFCLGTGLSAAFNFIRYRKLFAAG